MLDLDLELETLFGNKAWYLWDYTLPNWFICRVEYLRDKRRDENQTTEFRHKRVRKAKGLPTRQAEYARRKYADPVERERIKQYQKEYYQRKKAA